MKLYSQAENLQCTETSASLYAYFVKKLKLFNAGGWQYSVASVVSHKNVHAMKSLAEFLESFKNMRYWRLSYEMPFGSAGFDEIITAEDWNNFVDEILNFAKVRMKIKKIFPFDLYDKNMNLLNLCRRSNNCGSGRKKIYVYPDLSVYPCTCLIDFQ